MSKSVVKDKNAKEIAAVLAAAIAALVPLVINLIMTGVAKSRREKIEQLKNKDRGIVPQVVSKK